MRHLSAELLFPKWAELVLTTRPAGLEEFCLTERLCLSLSTYARVSIRHVIWLCRLTWRKIKTCIAESFLDQSHLSLVYIYLISNRSWFSSKTKCLIILFSNQEQRGWNLECYHLFIILNQHGPHYQWTKPSIPQLCYMHFLHRAQFYVQPTVIRCYIDLTSLDMFVYHEWLLLLQSFVPWKCSTAWHMSFHDQHRYGSTWLRFVFCLWQENTISCQNS